ncbi:hypothetical protein E3T37_16500 [Cryobacterium sp. TMT2-10]|uniref:pilus assembly PilX N-terminal domain-containing protein n=1 Tax=Cryobacterium sp. TMT2-10 TaxID=1259244 RepID=UPI00106B4061|nr:pilus assembly PilX N-terminal domain-containing protein [Cryobacterium sp. TMT2-10]TFD34760.1 hypothetical protein E3T37_16500 [Cryobacterium sp. TMT2-10]
MFLIERIHGLRRERGSALVGVIGVLAVASIVTLTVGTLTVGALTFTNSTRAGVQAQAAAESGVDVAAAALAAGNCQPTFVSGGGSIPKYSVAIYFTRISTGEDSYTGCPSFADVDRVRVVSTGSAVGPGTVSAKIEAVFAFIPLPVPPPITASGGAIYAFAQNDPTMNNLTVTQGSTVRPVIQYLSGSMTCTSQSTIDGDVILGQGSVSSMSQCTVNGDLWASGTVDMQSGKVTGNVNALGVRSGVSVTLSSSANVLGNVYAAGPVLIAGDVGGNVVSGPGVGGSSFTNQASIGGSVVAAGTVSYASRGDIVGTITESKSGIVTPTIPFVPGWADYVYDAGAWKTEAGVQYVERTMSSCGDLAAELNSAQNSLLPIIVDTRVCGGSTDFSSINLQLKSNMVLIANGFKFQNNDIQSSSIAEKRLWVITPDSLVDSLPTCTSASASSIGTQVVVGPHVSALVYTPCDIDNKADIWRGQIYARSVKTSAPFTLIYLPLGVPGVNLSLGTQTPSLPPGAGNLGDRISIRDLAG